MHDILMQAPALICLLEGPEHVFSLANPPYQQIVGGRPLLGKPIAEAMPELKRQRILELLDHVYRTGETFHAQEMKVQLDHGNAGWLGENYYNFVYQAMRSPEGNIEGILVFAYLVTAQVEARKRIEESQQALQQLGQKLQSSNAALSQSNRQLQQLHLQQDQLVAERTQQLHETLGQLQERNQELDQYVYKVSHDIRSPLASIQGLLGLIQLETVSPQAGAYLELIENRIRKLDEFTQSVLSHSRSLNTELTAVPIDFDEMIDQCPEELQHYPDIGRLRVERRLPPPGSFWGDRLRLQILLKNILSNAVKYRNPLADSFLTVRIAVTRTEAVIVLKDNGQGISEQYLPRIFDMFFRATDQADGSGLGLYIVKGAVERMGGSITLTSQVGKGTTFTVTLPNRKPLDL